jgi:hypothetical protein
MENIEAEKRNIAELAHDYVETYIKLTVANVSQKTADISASASLGLVAALIGFFVLMFLGIAASFWVAGLVNSNAGGFLIVSAFYILVLIILFATRKKFIYPMIKNLIVKSIYD